MTTAALVLAMLPIAMGLGEGSEWRSPMAVTVIGGLLTSTLLTLLLIPAVYTILDDFTGALSRVPAAVPSHAAPPRRKPTSSSPPQSNPSGPHARCPSPSAAAPSKELGDWSVVDGACSVPRHGLVT